MPTTPNTRSLPDDWAAVVYPFSLTEIRRLVKVQARVAARAVVESGGSHCTVQEAKRLAFARFLYRAGLLSEWKECRHVVP